MPTAWQASTIGYPQMDPATQVPGALSCNQVKYSIKFMLQRLTKFVFSLRLRTMNLQTDYFIICIFH